MFRATFLGHHGWLYAADRAHILVDPLFHDRFGLTDSVELRVHPPRVTDPSALPSIDAVILTHEHEGHFDLGSLALIDRSVPIHVPARSSVAMRGILTEMGFAVGTLHPGVPVTIKDLEFLPMTADQLTQGVIEEWDSLAYLVRDTAGHGSLFTSVDMPANEAMCRLVRTRVASPGLWAYTNNQSAWQLQSSWSRPDQEETSRIAQAVEAYHHSLVKAWTSPAASLIVGGGFSFGGDRAWLNRNVFTVDSHELAATLAGRVSGERWMVPIPGQTFAMGYGALVHVDEESHVVRTLPRDQWWPSRHFVGDVPWLDTYPPACGRRTFPEEEIEALDHELAALATHLYGRDLFRRLYSLTAADTPGRRPTVALALLADENGGAYVFEYAPDACRFVPAESTDPVSDYLAVFECWATDLLAFLRCEISSTALGFAYSRLWNANPSVFEFNLQPSLFEYVHPLRMPDRCLATYRRTVSALPASTPQVTAARAVGANAAVRA